MIKLIRKMTFPQIITFGFLVLILIGAALLSMPISSSDRVWTEFSRALFTSTSATCVTGLAVFDTASHWSLFGQLVILVLIQIGGLGFMSVLCILSTLTHRTVGLREKVLLRQSSGFYQVGGMIRMETRLIGGTLCIEFLGALMLSPTFISRFGLVKGLYYSVFHAVSAFCNAGFDLFGAAEPSLSGFAGNPFVLLPMCALIILGGLGFFVWDDILGKKFRWALFSLHTRIVLISSLVLIVFSTFLFLFFERNTQSLGSGFPERLLNSFFLSVTPRTAGFSITDYTSISESGSLLSMVLMLIGGCSGSTAGGLKVNTLAVLLVCTFSAARNNGSVTVGRRRLEDGVIHQASAISTIYIIVPLFSAMLICSADGLTLKQGLFETVSAFATVGSSLNVTPTLSLFSRLVITALMFGGRIGGLTLALLLAEKRSHPPVERPVERILIG